MISNFDTVWGGDDWQRHVLLLLKQRHGPKGFLEIPDVDRGDCGIEGFSTDGCAYQCYSPEGPLTVAQLTDKHKNKITRDILKFIRNGGKLTPILGQTKICCWVLAVPRLASKDVLAHAEKKAAEVRALNLSHVDPDFAIRVITDEYYAVERKLILDKGLSQLKVAPLPPDAEAVGTWAESHTTQVATLNGKLAKLQKSQDFVDKLGRKLILHYVHGQNVLNTLQVQYAEVHESVTKCKGEREHFLETQSLLATDIPAKVLAATITGYQSELGTKVPGIDAHMAELLTFEAVADWLVRCPLDFHP